MKRTILTLIFCTLCIGAKAQASPESIISLHPDKEIVPDLLSARRSIIHYNAPKDPESLTLLHFTDLHGNNENLKRIVEFYDHYDAYIDEAIHTGDCVISYYDDPLPWDEVPGAPRILNTIGNHDNWKGHKVWAESRYPYDATQEDVYKSIMTGPDPSKPYIKSWGVTQPKGADDPKSEHFNACYYYKDYPNSGIRMIVLDCMHYFDAQNAWFAQVLSDASAQGLMVVGVTHFPPQTGIDTFETGFSPMDRKMRAVPDPVDSQMERMTRLAYETVDKYIDAGGKFVCWLSGHTHTDFIGTVAEHPRQVVIIAESSGGGSWSEDRTQGTVNQDSFNLFTVNPSKGIFVVQRIGHTRDSMLRSKKMLVYDYIHERILVNE